MQSYIKLDIHISNPNDCNLDIKDFSKLKYNHDIVSWRTEQNGNLANYKC